MNNYGQFLVAHRGYSTAYPENTLLALESALTLGACFVEVDVHLSADHIPIVVHDADLQRTAGQSVNVMKHPLPHLQEYSVHEPTRFGNRYLPQRIPTLQAVVELIQRYPKRMLFIEAKRASIQRFGIETFLDALCPVIETIQEQCILISFDAQFLAAASQRQFCPVGWVLGHWGEESLQSIKQLQPEYVLTGYTEVPQDYETLPQVDCQWVVYSLDDAERALHWFNKGASLVETNNFGALIKHPALNTVC
jgi:glycerophosphoryl diester phosphodiesterase